MQAIQSGVWTKLDGYDVDVWHNSGCSVNVEVVDGKLATAAPHQARVELRPAGGVYTPGWRAPLAGWYRFGSLGPLHEFGTVTGVAFDMQDAAEVDGATRG